MAYSPFGYSLPQLSVTGYAAPETSWGGLLTVDVNVQNQGASSLIEPTNLAQGSTSTADSPATTVQVYAAAKPNATSGVVLIDTISIPSVPQNSNYQTISTIALPSRPAGFPGVGGKIYLTYVVDNGQAITQETTAGSVFSSPQAITIENPLPDLQVVGVDIPAHLQPGDVISPTIRIENLGTADPAAQGPVLVYLVASQTKNFGPGSAVLGSYVITSLPGVSAVPTLGSIANDANVLPTPNENTTTLPPLKLPTSPGTYFIGVVIDPFHTINQTYAPNAKLRNPEPVGPPDPYLPPASLLTTTNGAVPTFPTPPGTIVNPVISSTAPIHVNLFPPANTGMTKPVSNSRAGLSVSTEPGVPVVIYSVKKHATTKSKKKG
jgi:hypothetical protein